MVHSTWGDWFVRNDIEGTDVDGASAWYLGCNGFVVRSAETTIYIDPYFDDGDPPWVFRMIPVPLDPADATLCDAVLVTHEHLDHMHPPSYGPLTEELGGDLYAPSASFSEDRDYDGDLRAPDDQRHVVATGDTVEIGDFTVHVTGSNDPDAIEPVSYVIEHEDGTFFHAGDSRPAEAFHEIGEEFDIDLGVLAFGTAGHIHFPDENETRHLSWYMNENQVIEAANALQLDRLLPSHYDMWRGVGGDPKVLHEHAASHVYPSVVDVITIGDRVDFDSPGIVQSAALR
jgi:L-ascorbate 6-phosphate lactonase